MGKYYVSTFCILMSISLVVTNLSQYKVSSFFIAGIFLVSAIVTAIRQAEAGQSGEKVN